MESRDSPRNPENSAPERIKRVKRKIMFLLLSAFPFPLPFPFPHTCFPFQYFPRSLKPFSVLPFPETLSPLRSVPFPLLPLHPCTRFPFPPLLFLSSTSPFSFFPPKVFTLKGFKRVAARCESLKPECCLPKSGKRRSRKKERMKERSCS